MYLGVISTPLTLVPPVIYVNTDRGDIRHPVGIGSFSAAIRASSSR